MIEFRIAYPQDRWVTEDYVRGRYEDAVANGLCVKGKTGIEDIMLELEDTGEVTFITETGRGNPDRFDVLWRQIKIIDTCDT
jgi:hypothetical protein